MIHRSIALLVVLAMGCDDTDTESSTTTETTESTTTTVTAEPESEEAPETTPLGALMREHFTHAREARNALIAGDGDTAKEEMQWLATHDPTHEELPPGLRERFQSMRDAAAAFGNASGLAEAGEAYGKTLTACGRCHSELERGPEFATPPIPEGNGVQARMMLHRWVADRMWEGLVLASAEVFNEGASELGEVPLRADQLPEGALEPERIQAFADNVHALSDAAAEASSEEERAVVYGRFLATCAACHRALGMTEVVRDFTE